MVLGIDVRASTVADAIGTDTTIVEAVVSAIDAAAKLAPTSPTEPRHLTLPAADLVDRLAVATGLLEASSRVDLMPLMQELNVTARWLAANGAARDAPAAISVALAALHARLRGDYKGDWHAILYAAMVNLRSVRRQALVFATPMLGDADPGSTGVLPAVAAARVLPAFRKALLGLLKDRFEPATTILADACRELGAQAPTAISSRQWQLATEMFELSTRSAAADIRIAMKRMAVRLESFLRGLCVLDDASDCAVQAQLWKDVEALHSLQLRLQGDVGTLTPLSAETETDLIGTDYSKAAVRALKEGADLAAGLSALRDALLQQERYDDWFQVFKFERDGATRETVLDRLATWEETPVTVEVGALPGLVHNDLERAEAALRRLEGESVTAESPQRFVPPIETNADVKRPDLRTSAITVDEALLENLNLAASEIRGARSHAEANLGSMRGGLQDMERTIKSLRAQLEALEVDSSTNSEADGEANGSNAVGVPARLGALSRGIEELQGLQDALHALTEETESVLASQADEDSELAHGLLKTRLVPVATQFERWTEAVSLGAASPALGARLEIDGGDVMLERRQAAALSDALIPLLHACVSEAGAEHIAIDVSRPRFDLLLQVGCAGAPLESATWTALSAGFEKLGAIASRSEDTSGMAFRIVLSGPPQSVDVLLIDLSGQRFALPVGGVAGVLRRPQAAEADDIAADNRADAKSCSLAALLGMPEDPAVGAAPMNHVLLASGSEQRVACRVDAVHERECVLVRSPGPLLANNPWVWAVILNENAPPTLVLDVPAMVPALLASASPV